jgi:hypothetical protein
MLSRSRVIIAALTVATSSACGLGGCSVTGIGASERAHSEEAALRKLLHPDDSFDSIYKTLTKRGYQCADQVPLGPDQKPLDGARVVVCSKHMDLKLFCSWSVHVEKVKTDKVDQFDIWSLQACN